MAKISRIPTLTITDAAERRIQDLCKQLEIDNPVDLIDRALKAFEIMVEVSDKATNEVDVSSPTDKDSTFRVRIGS